MKKVINKHCKNCKYNEKGGDGQGCEFYAIKLKNCKGKK